MELSKNNNFIRSSFKTKMYWQLGLNAIRNKCITIEEMNHIFLAEQFTNYNENNDVIINKIKIMWMRLYSLLL